MGVIVLTDAKIYVGGYNLSGYSNEAHITQNPAMLDRTTFGNTTKINTAGMYDFKADVGGFMEFTFPLGAAPLDQTNSLNSALFAKITQNAAAEIASYAPLGNTEGDIAYTLQSTVSKFDPLGGAVGALVPYKLELNAAGIPVIRGIVQGLGLKTVTGGSATGIALGAVSATQKLYAGLHVVGASGTTPTLNVTVRSSALANMSSPTTRLTFPQFTTSVGASWQSVAGAWADTFYDVRWTIAGTSPNYTIFAVVGIL